MQLNVIQSGNFVEKHGRIQYIENMDIEKTYPNTPIVSNRGKVRPLNGDDLPHYVEQICDLISIGRSVDAAAQEVKINPEMFYRWLRKSEKAVEEYTRARENRAHVRFEKMQALLDDVRAGLVEPHAARVIVDAIKWQTGKEKAKVYGDTMTVRGDKDNPIMVSLAGALDSARLRRTALGDIEGQPGIDVIDVIDVIAEPLKAVAATDTATLRTDNEVQQVTSP